MSNAEVLQLRGQLAVARKNLEGAVIEASGLIVLIRSYLNPFENDLASLEIPKAAQSMKRLAALHANITSFSKSIAQMEEALGG